MTRTSRHLPTKFAVIVIVIGLVLGACTSSSSDTTLLRTVAVDRANSGLQVTDEFILWAAEDMCSSMEAALRNNASVSDWVDGMYVLNPEASTEQMNLMFAIAGAASVTNCPDVQAWLS